MKWEYDSQVKENTLQFNDGLQHMVVYKSAGGDYVVTCRGVDDPCGGEVEYFTSLHNAKLYAENCVTNGDWVNLVLDATP
jgi:hypothetical protein